VHPAAKRAAPLLGELSRILRRALQAVRNVLIENKTFTLSVHYRNVRKTDVRTVKSVVGLILRSYKNNLKLTAGKKVLEIRPGAPWSKGHAVRRFLTSIGHAGSRCVVYIGDDTTDEDVFRLLPSSAVTIRVGKDLASSAAFWVRTPSDVRKFLEIVDSINDRNPVR
jgi:trehalose-phosphatase